METTNKKYIYNHVNQETAYVVDDYPWGFRLRTKIRYWIESKDTKNGGQRFGSQTINPKTGQWCAPKYSTYSQLMVMYLDENDHVKCESLRMHDSEEHVQKFKDTHLEHMTEFEKKQLKEIIAFNQVMKHVTFEVKPSSIGPVSLFSKDPIEIAKRQAMIKEQEERKLAQEQEFKKINRAIAAEYSKVVL